MTDSEILALARSVREWLIPEAKKNGMPPDMTGMCAVAALELSRRLEKRRIRHFIVIRKDALHWHCWITVSRRIVDVTATQFGGPELYVGTDTRPGWFGYIKAQYFRRERFLGLIAQAPILKRSDLTDYDRRYIRMVQAYA